MDNGSLRTKIGIATKNYMWIITDEFCTFWVCFDWPFLLNIPVQVILDFGKSWLIVPGDWEIEFRKKTEYRQYIEFNEYSVKILELVMISEKDLHDYLLEVIFIIYECTHMMTLKFQSNLNWKVLL